MKKPKLVVGQLTDDALLVKSITTSKHFDWVKWLEPEEFVAFFADLLKLAKRISEGKKDAATLSIFFSEMA